MYQDSQRKKRKEGRKEGERKDRERKKEKLINVIVRTDQWI